MECVVWASTKARPPSDREESSDNGLEEDPASQIGDGILNDNEQDALRTLALQSDDSTEPLKETDKVPITFEESSEDGLGSDEDQCTSNLRRALDLSSPGSLRHRQIANISEMRVREKEERIAREEQFHKLRRDSLVARGVSRGHAKEQLGSLANPTQGRLGHPTLESY